MSRIISFRDTAANDSDKGIDLSSKLSSNIASSHFELLYALVVLTTSATVGNRLLTISVSDSSGNEIFHTHPGTLQPASKKYHYYLMPGIYRESLDTTSVDPGVDGTIQMPIPEEMVWNSDWSVRIYDKYAVDAAVDDMYISGAVEICND